jgi:hypothetical protein
MARIGIIFGLLLCALAGAGLTGSSVRVPSLVFPMMLGIPILFCGVVSLNPHRRKLAMFSAAIIGTFGLITGGTRAVYMALVWSRGERVNLFVFQVIALMAVLCLFFVVAYLVAVRRGAAGTSAAPPYN